MIQVLHRAFDILEYIAKDKSKPYTISEIARHLDINQATCANIIKTIMSRGYLTQVSKKEGYKLGKMSYYLTDNFDAKESLIEISEKPIEALAQKLNEGVIMAFLKEDERVILLDKRSTHEIQVINKSHKNAYASSTGRVLMACMPENEIDKYVEAYGLPDRDIWSQADSKEHLIRELAKIKEDSMAVQTSKNGIIGLAVPVLKNNKALASIGVYLPIHRYDPAMQQNIVEGLKETAAQINRKLRLADG